MSGSDDVSDDDRELSPDELLLEYLKEKDNLIIITFLYDEYQPYSCSQWGLEGPDELLSDKLPIIVNDGDFTSNGLDVSFFGNEGGVPKYVFIDKNFRLHHKETGYMNTKSKMDEIDKMLEGD